MNENVQIKNIYFIYGLELNKNFSIKSDFPIKIINYLEKKNDKNITYKISLYEIVLDKTKIKSNKSINLYLNEGSSQKGEYSFNISDKYQNIYLYDIAFKPGIFSFKSLPEQYNLTFEDKYELFRKFCNNENKIANLIHYTDKYIKKISKYNFIFFVSIIKDIKGMDNLIKHIELFDLNKVKIENEIKKDLIILNKLSLVIENINTKNLNEEKIINIFLFILIIFSKVDTKLIKIFFNDNNHIKYIFDILLNDKNKSPKQQLFRDLKLSFDILGQLIMISKSYKDIILIISYDDDFLDVLELINKNFEFIFTNLKKENNPNFEKIKFQNIINPKNEVNFYKINKEIKIFLKKEKEKNMGEIIEISCDMIKYYIMKNENNINQLIYLYKIIQNISFYRNNFKYLEAINVLEKKFNKFISEKKIFNTNLLKYIKIVSKSEKILNKEILNNIEIEQIDKEFIKRFRKINWCKLFNISKKDFVKNICSLIKDIKHFGKLFSLFDFNNFIDKECIEEIKAEFINLFSTFPKEGYPNYINDCAKLIYYLNVNNWDIKGFIETYFYNFFEPIIVHQVYSELCSASEFNIFHQEFLDCLKDFYNNKKTQNFIKSIYLLFEICYNEKFDSNDLQFYFFIYDDFFDLTQKDKFSFLEKIIEKKLLDKSCLKNYVKLCKIEANEIIKKIKDGTVEYQNIKKFLDKKKENKLDLKKRIEILIKFIDKYEENKNLFSEIEKKINEINKIINDLNIVSRKMNKYFPNERKEDMRKIQNIISELTTNNLDYYLKDEEKSVIHSYLNIKEINELPLIDEKSSVFFKIIYEKTKKAIKNETKIIEETKNKINDLINIIHIKEIPEEKINEINQIMNELDETQYKNLSKEIEDLIESNENNEEDENEDKERKEHIEKLLSFLKYLWKKDLIYNFSIFFEKMIENNNKIKKSEFFLVNNTINQNLKKNKKIKVIQLCLELYKNYNIIFNEENNFDFFLNIKLIPDINKFADFVLKLNIQDLKDKLNVFEQNKIFDDFQYMINVLGKLIDLKIFLDSILSNLSEDKEIARTFINEIANSKEYQNSFIALIQNFEIISNIFI